MPITDTRTIGSDGWWFAHLAGKLEKQCKRVDKLNRYAVGDAPLPQGADNAKSAYTEFQRKARLNLAELIVAALLERLRVRAIRTAVDADDDGDAEAMRMFRANRLELALNDALRWALTFGESYLLVGQPDTASRGYPLITAEHPSQTIAVSSALRPGVTRAALKLFHDEVTGTDYAYLWLPGRLVVAKRERRASGATIGRLPSWVPQQFDIDTDLSVEFGDTETGIVPVFRLTNPGGTGEFEPFLDHLDRINHMVLQRMVIATMQAFKQRALIADLPDTDDQGEDIDYAAIFTADPGALWRLPEGSQLWESGQADLSPMLLAVRDDILHLAAATRTPLSMFTPDAATQSAEGASLQREGLVFKAEDRQARFGEAIAEAFGCAFGFATNITDNETRADLDGLSVDWRPAERYSLQERATAAVAAKTADMPWRARASHVWQFDPGEVERQEAMRLEDMALAPVEAATAATNAATGTTSSQRLAQQRAAQLTAVAAPPGNDTGGTAVVGTRPTAAVGV